MSERANFGSKLGVILATAGSAVGLGNVWRFPYMAGENGGAVFIIVYILCVLLLGIPCMTSEFVIGRNGQSNIVEAYRKVAGKSPWGYVGYVGVITGFLVMGYYAVVSGWCLQYIYASAAGELAGDSEFVKQYFETFLHNPWQPLVWTLAIILFSHWIVGSGVQEGIERASKLMMPALFVLLIVLVVAACMLPGAVKGIEFLFRPDFSKLGSDVFLGALGQAFFSLSIGMGCLCTYASYFSRETDLTRSAVQIAVIDTIVAVLAGLMIFPAAFSVGVSPDSGPSLIFITLPSVFQHAFSSMPIVGNIVAMAFYALLTLAAITSLISMHEVSTAFLLERYNLSRKKSAGIVTAACVIIGSVCSLSLCGYEGLQVMGRSLFDMFDFVTGQIFLPVGGFLTCLFLGWVAPSNIARDQYTNWGTLRGRFFKVYLFCVRYVCPTCIAIIFIDQLGLI